MLSRADYNTDLAKIGNILLKRWQSGEGGETGVSLSQTYLQSRLEEIQQISQQVQSGGNDAACCAICLEAYEDPVITSCAVRLA